MLLEFLDDLLLVGDGEGGRAQNLDELGVLLEDACERLKRLCGGVKDVGFRGRGVLRNLLAQLSFQPLPSQIIPNVSNVAN